MNFGDYQLHESLSENGLSQTFRADHLVLKIPVFLKRWNPELLAALEKPEDYVLRAQAVTALNHPHLQSVLDAGIHAESPYTTTEFLESTDLGSLISSNGPLSQSVACEYIRQAAFGLQQAHEAGLAHGWLTPASLLLTPVERATQENGQVLVTPMPAATVKVADVGLLPLRPTIHDREFDPNADLGAVEYLPPERIGNLGVEPSTDVYGLGACLYYLLVGEPPFKGPAPIDVLLKIQQTDAPSVSTFRDDLDPAIVDIVSTMLRKQPETRPPLSEVIMVLLPFCEPHHSSLAPIIEIEPLSDHPEQTESDLFANSEEHAEEANFTSSRAIRKDEAGLLMGITTNGYLLIGGILNLIAIVLIVLYFSGFFDSKPPSGKEPIHRKK